jgi:hypothetical protein
MGTLNPSDWSSEPTAATRSACSDPWQTHMILAAASLSEWASDPFQRKHCVGD